MKIIYESDDGKQFNSLEDCAKYEEHITNMLNNELMQYIFYDEEWNIINATLENVEEIFDIKCKMCYNVYEKSGRKTA